MFLFGITNAQTQKQLTPQLCFVCWLNNFILGPVLHLDMSYSFAIKCLSPFPLLLAKKEAKRLPRQ